MARGNRLLVCFSHRRLFHPFDHVWIPFPACLRDWPEEQTGHHWLFTAAPCTHCLETHPEEAEKAQTRLRVLSTQGTPRPKVKVYKGRRAGGRQRPVSV